MTNNDTSVNNSNGVRIVGVAMHMLAWQNLSNYSLPNSSIDMVATNDGLHSVGVNLSLLAAGRL